MESKTRKCGKDSMAVFAQSKKLKNLMETT